MIQVSPGRTADTEAEMADDRGFTGYYQPRRFLFFFPGRWEQPSLCSFSQKKRAILCPPSDTKFSAVSDNSHLLSYIKRLSPLSTDVTARALELGVFPAE